MKHLFLILLALSFFGCAAMRKPAEPSFNEKMLKEQEAKMKAGENPFPDASNAPTSDTTQSSLWAKSVGSPYIIRNQKAQKVGDLLTIMVFESANATTSAKTDAKRDGSIDIGASLKAGQSDEAQLGKLTGTASHKNDFKGEGKTDRSGELKATVQAAVENVLPNGTLFVRGRKVVTINNEDQQVEISGFVRPDDIRINNTVVSSVLADAKIRYIGDGVISDKQHTGWGTRLLDAVWPF
jgi:flagellar L-ring protein precursor FlgH